MGDGWDGVYSAGHSHLGAAGRGAAVHVPVPPSKPDKHENYDDDDRDDGAAVVAIVAIHTAHCIHLPADCCAGEGRVAIADNRLVIADVGEGEDLRAKSRGVRASGRAEMGVA